MGGRLMLSLKMDPQEYHESRQGPLFREWMVRPLTAWLYLLGLLGLAILLEGRSPAPGLGLWTSILATVVVGYDLNRRSEGKRANWWIVAALLLGPLALIAYSYWRRGRSRGVPTMPAGTSPPTVPPPPPAPPAAWYADPHGEARLRYWDGAGWTAHVAN